jgi:hypothetical protein
LTFSIFNQNEISNIIESLNFVIFLELSENIYVLFHQLLLVQIYWNNSWINILKDLSSKYLKNQKTIANTYQKMLNNYYLH